MKPRTFRNPWSSPTRQGAKPLPRPPKERWWQRPRGCRQPPDGLGPPPILPGPGEVWLPHHGLSLTPTSLATVLPQWALAACALTSLRLGEAGGPQRLGNPSGRTNPRGREARAKERLWLMALKAPQTKESWGVSPESSRDSGQADFQLAEQSMGARDAESQCRCDRIERPHMLLAMRTVLPPVFAHLPGVPGSPPQSDARRNPPRSCIEPILQKLPPANCHYTQHFFHVCRAMKGCFLSAWGPSLLP